MERRARSLAIHCTMKRMENMSWALKPIASQTSSALDVLAHHSASLETSILFVPPVSAPVGNVPIGVGAAGDVPRQIRHLRQFLLVGDDFWNLGAPT